MLPSPDYVILPWPATTGGANVGCDSDNNVKLVKVYIPAPITVSSLTYRSGSSFTGQFWGFGLYDLDGNLVLDTGPVAQTTGINALVTVAIAPSVTLGSQMYWFAYTCTFISPSLITVASPGLVTNLVCDGSSIVAHATNPSVAGQLPATTGAILLDAAPGSSICPIIKLD